MTEVKRYRFKGAAGEYVYAVDFDKAQAEIALLKNGYQPVAEVVSGYSGGPDSRGSKQLKELSLDTCPVGTKLYAVLPELADLQTLITQQAAEIERLKTVTNFKDAVACVFDNLKMVAANTRSKEWDDQLEELAEEVIEFAPEYKKQWRDICKLEADLRSATADKEAYAQNAIDLIARLEKAIDMLYETSMAHSRIDQILIK